MSTKLNENLLKLNRILASCKFVIIGIEEDENAHLTADLVPVNVTKTQVERAILSHADRIVGFAEEN
jgi:hypothetical protein